MGGNKHMKAIVATPDGLEERQGALGVSVAHVDASNVDVNAWLAQAQKSWDGSRLKAATSQGSRAGTWIKPQGFENWEFFRCGLRHDPKDPTTKHQRARTEGVYEMMKASGWIDAPPGTKWRMSSGLEDASVGIYVCLPREYASQFRKEKHASAVERVQAQKRQAIESNNNRVDIEEIIGDTRSFTVDIAE